LAHLFLILAGTGQSRCFAFKILPPAKDVQGHLLPALLLLSESHFAPRSTKEDAMPYPPEHKDRTRQRILESARQVFNKKGFSEATIGEIMAAAGLSHGGFYRHFGSKSDLYAEAVRRFLCKEAPDPWQAKQINLAKADKTKAQRVIDAYFSLDHFDDRERCCPLIGLPSEASRSNGDVKGAYQEVVEKLLEIFKAELEGPHARERAFVLVALCVGGMVLARGVDDAALADDIRGAAYRHALGTAGWRAGQLQSRRKGRARRSQPADWDRRRREG
jgi:AcrR family transcriptional regulator